MHHPALSNTPCLQIELNIDNQILITIYVLSKEIDRVLEELLGPCVPGRPWYWPSMSGGDELGEYCVMTGSNDGIISIEGPQVDDGAVESEI